MSKRKVKKAKKFRPVRIKKVVMEPSAVIHVKVPADHHPIVAVHPDKGIVEIVPVPKKKETWWDTIFG